MKATALLIFLAFGAISGLALACLLAMAIFDIEERAAARMRQATLNRKNQDHEMLHRDSRLSSKGESAEITAQKIGVKKPASQSIYTDRYNYQPCDLGLSIGWKATKRCRRRRWSKEASSEPFSPMASIPPRRPIRYVQPVDLLSSFPAHFLLIAAAYIFINTFSGR